MPLKCQASKNFGYYGPILFLSPSVLPLSSHFFRLQIQPLLQEYPSQIDSGWFSMLWSTWSDLPIAGRSIWTLHSLGYIPLVSWVLLPLITGHFFNFLWSQSGQLLSFQMDQFQQNSSSQVAGRLFFGDVKKRGTLSCGLPLEPEVTNDEFSAISIYIGNLRWFILYLCIREWTLYSCIYDLAIKHGKLEKKKKKKHLVHSMFLFNK